MDSIDAPLKNRLWNNIYSAIEKISPSYREHFYKKVWKDFFVLRISDIPRRADGGILLSGSLTYLENWYNQAEWYEIYDFIVYLIGSGDWEFENSFIEDCNEALRLEMSAYRIIDKYMVKINAEEEIRSIEEALDTGNQPVVGVHLRTALALLSDRKNPDFRNSIKESISAVEAQCKLLAEDEKATLGKALAILERNHKLHSSFKLALNNLYGFASGAGGIRHALLENDIQISFEEAKFMLVICTAFINLLKRT